jgi:hypothetical protein
MNEYHIILNTLYLFCPPKGVNKKDYGAGLICNGDNKYEFVNGTAGKYVQFINKKVHIKATHTHLATPVISIVTFTTSPSLLLCTSTHLQYDV